MEYRKFNDTYVIRLNKGEEVIESLKDAWEGFLEEHGVKLIGTKLDAIDRSEDRELFKAAMEKIRATLTKG